jgi:hypothetical protein
VSVRVAIYAVVALIGGAVGALLVSFFGPLSKAEPVQQAAARSTDAQQHLDSLSTGQANTHARLAALEMETRLLASANAARDHGASSAELADPANAPHRQTEEEERQANEAQLAAHAAEPVDVAWALAKSQSVTIALDGLNSPGNMQVSKLECRSKTCLARLSWPTRSDALESRKQVVALLTGDVGCERHLFLGGDERSGSFEGTLLLKCPR